MTDLFELARCKVDGNAKLAHDIKNIGDSRVGIVELLRLLEGCSSLAYEPGSQRGKHVELLARVGLDDKVVPVQWPHPQLLDKFLPRKN